MSARNSFHRNVFLLTQAVLPSKEFQKYFKEGMFDKPNTQGFIHVSHYLLTIYDEERFKRATEWPILDKRAEAKYRNDVKEFLTIIINENNDIECPTILSSSLMTASGTKFINLMWKLSQIVLRTYLKRSVGPVLGAPKPDNGETVTKLFFNNTIATHELRIEELNVGMKKSENEAREFVKDRVKTIEAIQSVLFEARKRLHEVVENINVHTDIKKRISNTNDKEVIELWKKNIQLGIDHLKQQIALVKDIEEKSTKVNNLVTSLFSDARKILDGKNLPKIDTTKLMELPLKPEAKVALHHMYVDDKLSINNFFVLLNSILGYLYIDMKKNGFPDLSECKLQIQGSTDDLNKICTVIDKLQNRINHISNELKNTGQLNNRNNIGPEIFLTDYCDNIDTALLKASPIIHFNSVNFHSERHDVQERLKLTPVEMQPRPLFSRYKVNRDVDDLPATPVRSKMMISRINFDDTLSESSPRTGAICKQLQSSRVANQSTIGTKVPKKYARLFSARPGILANSSIISSNSWKASTFIEGYNNGTLHNVSDLRAQLATTSSANVSLDLPTPIKFTSQCNNIPPNTLPIKNIETPKFNSSEVIPELQTISETTEIQINTNTINKITSEPEKQKGRRLSIGDLVDRYKKIRDQSICTTNLHFDIEHD